jgi:hypothetical protein
MSALAPTLQAFFTERLIGQRQASPHTIAAYRDTFRLLLVFAQQRTGIRPHALDIADLDATLTPRSWITSNTTAATIRGPATPGWRRSARSTTTPPCGTPNTPKRSRGCSRSRPSDTSARSSTTSPSRRPQR